MPWKRQDLPRSWGISVCLCPALRPRQDRHVRPSRHADTAPAMSTTKAPTNVLSRLHHTASALAVYASQDELLHHHARLASGCWSSSTGRDWIPARFQRKVSNSHHVRHPPFPSFVAQGHSTFAARRWLLNCRYDGVGESKLSGVVRPKKEDRHCHSYCASIAFIQSVVTRNVDTVVVLAEPVPWLFPAAFSRP